MKAGNLLTACAAIQFLLIVINVFSVVYAVMLVVSLLGSGALVVSIWFKWRRGVELFIFVTLSLFLIALIPFCMILADNTVSSRAYEFTCYCLEITVELLSLIVAVWILYQVDNIVQDEEQKPMLQKVKESLRQSSK
mmetsp:Transcript_23757/g.64004  ORF Transcript_23757/g.64004 Transcript_23757/m.64004 type:complete len:137 (-) Transcript_23757:112-522(-)